MQNRKAPTMHRVFLSAIVLALSYTLSAQKSVYSLQYQADGSVILPVRLQEMFGQQEVPTLCLGRVEVTLHLLSPARFGRP